MGGLPAPPLPFVPFSGAFCIPDALPGIPFGDGNRIWTPAFGCYPEHWQHRICDEMRLRRYGWLEYQVSGKPYREDYPELAVDPARVVHDLVLLRQRGLRSIMAFDDTKEDLTYLEPIAAVTQDLVDCTMGLYEVNGVFDWDEDRVARVLERTKQLWPKAINAFHSTSQDDGGRGFGDKTFWLRVAPFVDVYFLQQSAWNHSFAATVDRAMDFALRLIPGSNGWPKLKYGMILFEETTSVTYRGLSETYGIHIIDQLLAAISPRPTGFMDGGTVLSL
jgi:hypothetical protein